MKTNNQKHLHVYEDSDVEDYTDQQDDYMYVSKPVVSKKLRNMVIGAVILFFVGIAGYAYWASLQGGR